MSDTHYETLGVSPDASRDEIRDAYRARVSELEPETWKGDASERRDRAASVNKAWNVLSDPFQKERYDSGIDDSIAGVDDVDVIDADATTGEGGKPARGNASAVVSRGTARAKVTPTGLAIAPTRARINALSVDVLVILVLLFALNFVAGALFSNPAVQVTINDKIVSTTEIKDRDPSTVRAAERSDAVAEWEKDNPDARKDPKVEVDEVDVVPGNVTLLFQLITLVVALLYTVVPSARTGQTLGKRIFKVKLVSVDGNDAGWAQCLLHYGVPIAIAIALALLGAVVAIGMVVWSIWDKNGQSINDKIAKTFVVEA
ncbi:MAG: RDD family protein [Acidimicrobiia bacterium]